MEAAGVRLRQVLLSVAVVAMLKDGLPEENTERLEFLFVESLGLAAGQVDKGTGPEYCPGAGAGAAAAGERAVALRGGPLAAGVANLFDGR